MNALEYIRKTCLGNSGQSFDRIFRNCHYQTPAECSRDLQRFKRDEKLDYFQDRKLWCLWKTLNGGAWPEIARRP